MNPMPVVLDISSDEESGLEEQYENLDDWIKGFLGMSDEESDNSDEVVFVREVISERRSKCSKPIVKDVDDDDCVVLEGNPENGVASVNEEETESDELQIVGEKGQIACRDYPHARHLCATFPFSSTSHEKHCNQCHCYVCDSLAPCLKWGTGISITDHCHATDKVEMWKIQRKNAKLGMNSPLPASANNGTSPCVAYPQQNLATQQLDIIRLYPNSISQNQESRPTAIRPCSTLNPIQENLVCGPTIMHAQSDLSLQNYTMQNQISRSNTFPVSSSNANFTVPIGSNHGRRQELGSPLARNRFQPHVPSQLLGVRNNVIRRDRGRNAGPQYIHMVAKVVGSVGDAPTLDHSAHVSSGYSNHVNPAVQNDGFYGASGLSSDRNRSVWNNTFISPNLTSPIEQNDRYNAAIGISNDRNYNGRDSWTNPNLSLYTHRNSAQPNQSCVNENIVPSETQAFGQPLSQPNNSQNFYQSCIQGNAAHANYESCLNGNQQGNEHQIGMQHGYATESIIHCGNTSQDACQQKPQLENQSEIARKGEFSIFDLGWSENTNQSSEPVVASSHLPCLGSIQQLLNVEESDTQQAGNINASTLDEFQNWFLEKDSVLGVVDAAVPSELNNIPSPNPYPIDAGMLYDFETFWNGLAHV